MECSCGNVVSEVLIDLTRKSDGETAENIIAKHCDVCNVYFIDFGGVSFE